MDLKPCPFCGGEANVCEVEDGPDEGGFCIVCDRCMACSAVHFDRRESLYSDWNRRADEALKAENHALRNQINSRQVQDAVLVERLRNAGIPDWDVLENVDEFTALLNEAADEIERLTKGRAVTDVDWRDMFWRYIEIVAHNEGVDFLYAREWPAPEWEAIQRLEAERVQINACLDGVGNGVQSGVQSNRGGELSD